MNIHWKDWCWSWNSNTLATWHEQVIHLKSPWCWERLSVRGEGVDRGWNGLMASMTEWTWVCINSGSWGEGNGNPLLYSCWKIPWTEEPGRLQSRGLLRVEHDWSTSLSLFTFMHWRRKWQPTPVSFPGESQGRGSLVGCHLWGRTESETTEAT